MVERSQTFNWTLFSRPLVRKEGMGLPAASDRTLYMVDRKDMGRADSLRYNVISFVREENYSRAILELEKYLDKPSDYPRLKDEVERFIKHAIDLVRAVEMKRSFPGMTRLTVAKQQDLKLKVKQHVDELVFCLKKIERIEIELRVEDVRSTIIVVNAVVLSVFGLAVVAFVLELSRGLLLNTFVVVDDSFRNVTDWFFALIGA